MQNTWITLKLKDNFMKYNFFNHKYLKKKKI